MIYRCKSLRIRHFNPRPPWGGRPGPTNAQGYYKSISIHALRGEGDVKSLDLDDDKMAFQSTPSVGRATSTDYMDAIRIRISIHALRGEGDRMPGLPGA